MTDYLVYDVFADRPFGGNPLAVIPVAEDLAEDLLQRITREFGFSETVFVFPPGHGETARLRIFTPRQEIPFAGHPVIGAAVATADLGARPDMVLGLPVGALHCRAEQGRATFRTRQRLEILHRPEPARVATCLGLPASAVRHAVTASVGMPFVLAEIDAAENLARCAPVLDGFHRGAGLYPAPFDFAVYAWRREGETVWARMFAPLDDIAEDPATGSAAAALAAWLRAETDGPVRLAIRQGETMGRPSRIDVAADAEGVTVSGEAVRVMSGRLHL